MAETGIDIRVDGVLFQGQDEVPYVASIGDCSQVNAIVVSAGES